MAVALALAGVANATMRPRPSHGGGRIGVRSERAVATTSRRVSSSAWYCPGPLPFGGGKEASSIAVANVGDQAAHGRLVVTTSAGSRSVASITVAAHAQAVFGLPRHGPSAHAAATILVDSAGVGVEELIHGGSGPMSAPCSVTTGRDEYLAVGSTRGKADVHLAVYNPGATPAVVGVSFATTTGGASPPAFQGVDVAPGHVTLLDVARQVASRQAVATIVHATGGHVVVGAVVRSSVDHRVLTSLVGASPWPARHWDLPAAPLGKGARQSFSVLNPTDRSAHVVVHLAGPGGGEVSEAIPPGAVVAVGPSATRSAAATGATLASTGAPVVVARELALGSRLTGRASKGSSRPAPGDLPGLPVGFSAAAGTTGPHRRWLLPGGEADRHVDEVVTVTNPGSEAARVEVLDLADQTAGTKTGPFTVPPGGSVAVPAKALGVEGGNLSLVVEASSPVVAGQLLYAAGHDKVGLAAGAGIPVN